MASRNKRKRLEAAADEQQSAPPPLKAFKRGLTLTDLADELILSVLSYFDFKERSKLRRVCSRLIRVIDAMPPPPNLSLSVCQDEDIYMGRRILSRRGVPTAGRSWVSVWVSNKIQPAVYIYTKQQEEEGVALWSPENLPVLKAVRPHELNVGSLLNEDKVDVKMLKHLGKDVGKTVTNLYVSDLQAANVDEVKEAFSLFAENRHGGKPLTKLELSPTYFPLEHAVLAITCLQDLISLDISITEAMLPTNHFNGNLASVGRPLSALASLPNLQELTINIHSDENLEVISSSFMNSFSAIKELKRLFCGPLRVCQGECSKAFAQMLHSLPNLEELGGIRRIDPQTWRQIHTNGGHRKLRKLMVNYSEVERNEIDALVHGCNQDFPSLVELELHIENLDISVGEFVLALENLKTHSSLLEVKCGWRYKDEKEGFVVECQRVLGESIKVTEINHIDYP